MLSGVRIVEVAMFAPDALGMHLADLGAEVIKVERPGIGDPARFLGVPYRGESTATRRWNRGKHSLTLDLASEDGRAVFRDLVSRSDAVVEGMRPGAMERRGLGYEALLACNPKLVFASLSGWGSDGPYRDLGSHGLAFDSFAGLAKPRVVDGRVARPGGQVFCGVEVGPLYAALAVVSGIVRARTTGEPAHIEVSQADAGAVWNYLDVSYRAALDEHGPHPDDPDARTLLEAMATAADAEDADRSATDVRYQYYATSDGTVLFMATETRFWENFCRAVDRRDWFERWPGRSPADHDYGNDALRDELTALFRTRTTQEWVRLFIERDVAGAPVHDAETVHRDPHFRSRDLFVDPDVHGVRILGSPVRVDGSRAVASRTAPAMGADGEDVLRRVLGYDEARIEALRSAGTLGGDR